LIVFASDEFRDSGKGLLCLAVGPLNGGRKTTVVSDLLDDTQSFKQMRRLESAEIQYATRQRPFFL
jgi:hypothetical protein